MPIKRLRPRILYMAVFAWISVTSGRFLSLFLKEEASLHDAQIGMLLAIHQAMSVASSSIVSTWADSMEQKYPGRGRSRFLIIGVSFGGFVFLLHGAKRVFPNILFLDSIMWYSFLRIVLSGSSSFIFPVMDGMCLDFLKRENGSSPKDYGKERLYGAISWAVAHIFIAPCLDSWGFGIFYPLSIIATILLLSAIHLYSQGHCRDISAKQESSVNLSENGILENNDGQQSLSMWSLIRNLFASCFGFAFMFAVFISSSGQAIVDNLVFLYFDFLGSSYTLMGVSVVLTVGFEIPIFHVAPTLLNIFGSGYLLLISSVCYIIRVVGYSLVPRGKMLYVLLLEPLHGVTYACSSSASVDFVSNLMPSQYEASGQGILQLFGGSGSIIGLLFGGFAQDHLGPRLMYQIAALVVFMGSIFLSLTLALGQAKSEIHFHNLIASHDKDEDFEMTEIENKKFIPAKTNEMHDLTSSL